MSTVLYALMVASGPALLAVYVLIWLTALRSKRGLR